MERGGAEAHPRWKAPHEGGPAGVRRGPGEATEETEADRKVRALELALGLLPS